MRLDKISGPGRISDGVMARNNRFAIFVRKIGRLLISGRLITEAPRYLLKAGRRAGTELLCERIK